MMDDAKYLAVGRIFLEETKASMPVPAKLTPEARAWHAALMRRCSERSEREQGVSFAEWQNARPSPGASAAYGKMVEEILGEPGPS